MKSLFISISNFRYKILALDIALSYIKYNQWFGKCIIYKTNTTYQTYAASFKISPISPMHFSNKRSIKWYIFIHVHEHWCTKNNVAKQLITNYWYKMHNLWKGLLFIAFYFLYYLNTKRIKTMNSQKICWRCLYLCLQWLR